MILHDQVRNTRTDARLGEPELCVECTGCGCEFHVDSSPNLTLCWQCDERAGEADW